MRRRHRHVRDVSPAEFIRSKAVRRYFERMAFESKVGWALTGAGFSLIKLERVSEHRLTMAWAATPSTNDTRTVRHIRGDLRRAFQHEGLMETMVFQEHRRLGAKTRVILGVFDR